MGVPALDALASLLPDPASEECLCFCTTFVVVGGVLLFSSKPVSVGSVVLLVGVSSACANLWMNALRKSKFDLFNALITRPESGRG